MNRRCSVTCYSCQRRCESLMLYKLCDKNNNAPPPSHCCSLLTLRFLNIKEWIKERDFKHYMLLKITGDI